MKNDQRVPKKVLADLIYSTRLLSKNNSLPMEKSWQQEWWSATGGCIPNDWSVCIRYLEEPQFNLDGGVIPIEIYFLMEKAEYLVKPGNQFQLADIHNCNIIVRIR